MVPFCRLLLVSSPILLAGDDLAGDDLEGDDLAEELLEAIPLSEKAGSLITLPPILPGPGEVVSVPRDELEEEGVSENAASFTCLLTARPIPRPTPCMGDWVGGGMLTDVLALVYAEGWPSPVLLYGLGPVAGVW